MLPLQFFGQNAHFAINLFAALVCFAVFWLYFDAWTAKRQPKDLVKIAGFLLVAVSFLLQATVIEQTVLIHSSVGNFSQTLSLILRTLGYIGIIVGQLIDPMQAQPDVKALKASDFSLTSDNQNDKRDQQTIEQPEKQAKAAKHTTKIKVKTKSHNVPAVAVVGAAKPFYFLLPLGALAIAWLYWRRATVGLERHLRPIAIAFFVLFGYELLALTSVWQDSNNPVIARWTAPFGPLWSASQVLLLVGAALLCLWVWRYLIERFFSQLFMVFISMTLAIFLVTTVGFTYLLTSNVQKSALDNLQTSSSVLNYAINGKKAETLADTQAVAANPDIVSAVSSGAHDQLVSLTKTFLHDKQQSSLVITNNVGQVLLRAEDPDRFGDSVSSDTLVRRSLIGQSNSTVTAQDGVLAPSIFIRSAVPVEDSGGNIVGSASVGLVINNAFVDGIKHATGLETAIYAGNIRSATTFLAPDGVSRWIGVKENSATVDNTVLKHGQIYRGTVGILNRQFLGVYAPLKDVDNTVIGMLFIGQPSLSVVQTAGHSIALTFLLAVVLLVISIFPAFVMARYIAKQLE